MRTEPENGSLSEKKGEELKDRKGQQLQRPDQYQGNARDPSFRWGSLFWDPTGNCKEGRVRAGRLLATQGENEKRKLRKEENLAT